MDDQASEIEALQRLLLADSIGEPVNLSYAVMKSVTNNFSKEIGCGGFGVVYLGTLQKGMVAVKELKTSCDIDSQLFVREIACLTKARHKNIVRFLGYCADSRHQVMNVHDRKQDPVEVARLRLLCLEYVPNGSLRRYLTDNSDGNDWSTRYKIIKGICLGLQYLQQQEMCHLDLKPDNVLLDVCMEPKIADFGLSRFFNGMSRIFSTTKVGTLGYMAPEYIQDGEISIKTDIYSLGRIMNELLMGQNKRHDTENCIKPQCVDCPKIKKCLEIAERCVDHEKRNRPTIDEIIDELNKIENTVISQTPYYQQRELLHVQPKKLSYYPLGMNNRMPFSLQLTNTTDSCLAFMFIDFGKVKAFLPCRSGVLVPQATWGLVIHLAIEAGEQEVKQCKDMVLVRSTTVSKDVKAADITIDWFNRQSGVQDVELDVVLVPPLSEPQPQLCDATTQSCPGSIKTELLEIYPLELRFPFEPKKFIDAFINLTNKTNEDITFSIRSTNPSMYWQKESFVSGTVSPGSTCSIIRSIKVEEPVQDLGLFQILMATSRSLGRLDAHDDEITNIIQLRRLYTSATVKGGKAHEAQLCAVISNPDPGSRRKCKGGAPGGFGEIRSIDVHCMRPWILTGHHQYVLLWEIGVEEDSIQHKQYDEDTATDFVVKFVEGRKLVLLGDSFGKIRVLTTKLRAVSTFIAHRERIRSLAAHPSDPYVLSSSDDHLIKLWDCDNDWTCIREFRGNSSPAIQMTFNPKDTDSFVSVSGPFSGGAGIVKIWRIRATDPKIDLNGGFEAVDYSATVSDRLYMVTVAHDGNTQIWDQQTDRCRHIHTLINCYYHDSDDNASNINVVACHPKLPLIFTGAKNGTVCIWNLNTYRLEHMVTFSYGGIKGFGFIDIEGQRLVIGCANRLLFMEIDLQKLAGLKGRELGGTQLCTPSQSFVFASAGQPSKTESSKNESARVASHGNRTRRFAAKPSKDLRSTRTSKASR